MQRVLGETGSGQVFRAVLAAQAARPDCISFDLVDSAMLREYGLSCSPLRLALLLLDMSGHSCEVTTSRLQARAGVAQIGSRLRLLEDCGEASLVCL